MAGDNSIHSGDYSAHRYAEFFDSLPAPLFRTTIEGKMVYCNHALANLLGFDSAVDLIDYPVIEFYQNKKDRGHIIHTVIQTGGVFEWPVALKKRDGTPIWCKITAKAIFDDDGNAIHLDGVLKDVTHITRQRQQKAESQKFQGVLEMAGGVAHRLNQPLTIINNQINEIMSEIKQDKRLHGQIVKIQNQIKKLNDITDKLGRIKKYEAMDYVAGVKIVDIEKSSWSHEGKEDR
jgi:PAS domain S-box-containing protein